MRRKQRKYGPLHLLRDIALAPVLIILYVVDRILDN